MADRSNLRIMNQPIWDTAVIKSGSSYNRVAFFASPMGMPLHAEGPLKTEHATNLRQSGCLGSSDEFDMYGIGLEFFSDEYEGVRELHAEGFYSFCFGFNKSLLGLPVSSMNASYSSGLMPGRSMDHYIDSDEIIRRVAEKRLNGERTTMGDIEHMIYDGYFRSMVDATVNGEPVRIGSTASFGATIECLNYALQCSCDITIRNTLYGTKYTAL